MDNLMLLKTRIDLARNEIITPKVNIKLAFKESSREIETHTIDGLCEQIIKIKICNIENGNAIVPKIR
jgi:hypothetical protein